MSSRQLSSGTMERIVLLFRPDQQRDACGILSTECGNNLPFLEKLDATGLERVRFAALKLSQGDLKKLKHEVTLAKRDWRDLLVAADFADDLEAHKSWLPSPEI